jgi:uncharacterized membrane protein
MATAEVTLADVKGAILVVGGVFILLFGAQQLGSNLVQLYFSTQQPNTFGNYVTNLDEVGLGISLAFVIVGVVLLLWARQVFRAPASPAPSSA